MTFHFFDRAFDEKNGETSLALFGATLIGVLVISYGLSRVSDRLIQGRATRLSRRLLASVDRRFHPARDASQAGLNSPTISRAGNLRTGVNGRD